MGGLGSWFKRVDASYLILFIFTKDELFINIILVVSNMKIEELSENLYEDLNGRISGVESSDNLIIQFECDDWNGFESTRFFKIICEDVVESDVYPTNTSNVEYNKTHILLWDHNEPRGSLFYSSEPKSKHELLGKIWEIHEELHGGWRPLTDYLNTYNSGTKIGFCEGSNGLLANGSKPLLEQFQIAIDNYIKNNLVISFTPKGGYKALVFDECFAICKSVKVIEFSN